MTALDISADPFFSFISDLPPGALYYAAAGAAVCFLYYVAYQFFNKSHLLLGAALVSAWAVEYLYGYGLALVLFYLTCAGADFIYRCFIREEPSRYIPKAVREKVYKKHGGKCKYCGSRRRLEYDHIFPFAHGGKNTVRNLQLLCFKCNRRKGKKVYWF